MAKIDPALRACFDALTDEQIERKVEELKATIPNLNAQLDYLSRQARERRAAAHKKRVEDARSR